MPTQSAHYPGYVWHPDVHEKWANESLHYVRLGFAPRYDRKTILVLLTEYFAEHNITSYEWNETYGPYDLILRLWLRPEHRPEIFHNHLRKYLQDRTRSGCKFADAFHIEQIHYHWRWPTRANTFSPLSLPEVPDFRLIAETAAGATTPIVKAAAKRGVISKYEPRNGKVHFYMSMPGGSDRENTIEQIPQQIVKYCASHRGLRELAVYIGNGSFDILVEGKVLHIRYEEIAGLSNFLNETGLMYGAKIETYVVTGSSQNSFRVVEALTSSTPAAPPVRDYTYYASTPETQALEKKGSLWTDLDRMFCGDGTPTRDLTHAKKGAIKSVVGMLNTSGGQVIIGLLEAHEKYRHPTIEARLKAYETLGDCYIVGIETEATYKNWDKYEQHVRDLVRSTITPPVTGMGLVQLTRVPANDKSLAVITVRPGPPTEVFRVDGIAYVRDGNSTQPLPEAHVGRHVQQRINEYHAQHRNI